MLIKSSLVLYHTSGCHLCEQAYTLLQQAAPDMLIELQDIVDDEQLMAWYQTRIPVVENKKTGQKLYWPFSIKDVSRLI